MADKSYGLPGDSGEKPGQPQILFQIGQRVILNHYSAKRLAITLGQ